VLGRPPAADPEQLARVGFVAQDTPTYARLSIRDHLYFGAQMNPRWDDALARRRIAELDLDFAQKAGSLSAGQRAQLALTLAVAKRPELLVLDGFWAFQTYETLLFVAASAVLAGVCVWWVRRRLS
jgi:ABC-2 type transport system ATP-binding protein